VASVAAWGFWAVANSIRLVSPSPFASKASAAVPVSWVVPKWVKRQLCRGVITSTEIDLLVSPELLEAVIWSK